MKQVLIIEDDIKLAGIVREYLAGFEVTTTLAHSGADGVQHYRRQTFDAVILDLMLPDINGLDLFKKLREISNVPVLMLTAKGDPIDRIIGLELGADDYLPKPFEPREMLARLRTIMRRGQSETQTPVLRFGRLEVDEDAAEARLDDQRCDLTPYQFQLLTVMARGAGRVLSREYLMNHLQGHDLDAFDRSIDVHISRIRAEIEADPKKPRRVVTVRGSGYLFARSQD